MGKPREFAGSDGSHDPAALLSRARSGDQSAWEDLFRTCYPKVVRVVRRKLDRPMRSFYDATDFANDVMLSLFENIGQIDFPSIQSLMTYLAQVAEQKVIDEYRRRHTLKRDIIRERQLIGDEAPDTADTDLASSEPTASQLVDATEILEELQRGQSVVGRKIIEMRQLGYSSKEIAEQTGWNIRKVQRFFRDLSESMSHVVDKPEPVEVGRNTTRDVFPAKSKPHVSVYFDGNGLTEEEVELFLSYLAETYRTQGGVGLEVSDRRTFKHSTSPVEAL